jgi:hypothetical protein
VNHILQESSENFTSSIKTSLTLEEKAHLHPQLARIKIIPPNPNKFKHLFQRSWLQLIEKKKNEKFNITV